MQITLKKEAILKKRGIETPTLSLPFSHLTPSLSHALWTVLEGGEEEPKLTNAERPLFYYYLELLKKHALIVYKTPLLELIPFNGDFSVEKNFQGAYCFSRFALIRSHEEEFIIETPLSAVLVRFKNLEVFHFLSTFRKAVTLEESVRLLSHLPVHTVEETFFLLASAKILTATEETAALQQWEFHDLFFHTRCRLGRHNAPFGGTFPFKEVIPPPPAFKQCNKESIALAKPMQKIHSLFENTLQERISLREQGEKPPTMQQLGEFLYRCAAVKKTTISNGEELISRPYPGGGACYELEVYPIIYQCEGIKRGVYHYHPCTHQLCKIKEFNEGAEQLLRDAQWATKKKKYPQILFVVSARFQKVSWKYQSLAYALILKNVGALFQTMYLVATAMRLAPCAVGAGNSDLFCEVIGTDYFEETSVGEFILGTIPEADIATKLENFTFGQRESPAIG